MADAEETLSQRQARIRREKREAKIKGAGTERLDKITRLSGRTPESMRGESQTDIPSPIPPSPPSPPISIPSTPSLANAASPAQMQAQEEYLRKLLRTPAPQPSQGQAELEDQTEDPMMKMMNQLLGSMGGNAAGGEGGLPISPDDISKATGLPSFLTDMFLGKGKTPPTPAQERTARFWNIIHTIFALIASVYVVSVISRSVDAFGARAPAPATFQNPFLVFVMGELLVQGAKAVTAGQTAKHGLWLWLQVLKDIVRDGCIVVFAMGMSAWWKGLS